MELSDFLICPVCGAPLVRRGGSLVCRTDAADAADAAAETKKHEHCFDLSSRGYADLSHRNGGGGDPRDAVADRTAFLDRGYYAPLADAICRLIGQHTPPDGLVIDAGCGEGYYSERIAEVMPEGFVFGVDLSKHAVDHACRRRRVRGGDNSFYAVASVFSIPAATHSASGALCMFSPVPEEEMLRLLKPGGVLVIGSAAPDHLMGFKRAIYDEVYPNEPRADLPRRMRYIGGERVTYTITLGSSDEIMRLFGMTPYRFRTSEADIARLSRAETVTTEISVDFGVYAAT